MSLSSISVNNQQVVGIDNEPTAGSNNLVKSSGVVDVTSVYKELTLSTTKVNIIAGSINEWIDYSANRYGIMMPVEQGKSYKIITGNRGVSIAILKDNVTTSSESPNYSSAYPTYLVVPANTEFSFATPVDANYIWLDRVISGVTIIYSCYELVPLKEEVQTIKNTVKTINDGFLIKLSGIGTFSPEIVPNVGDVFFNTTMNLLRKRLAPIPSLDFETVPFINGAIYTYNEELYIWNGASLVKKTSDVDKTPEVSENTDNTDFGISDYNGNVIMSLSEGHIRTQKFDSSKLVQKLKILLIGNSYSADSFAYVPFILKNYGIDIEIGIYLRGGASLQNHIDEWQSGSWPFFYIDSAKDNKWTKISQYYNPKLSVQYTDWDIIVLQQGSVYSLSWNNFEPQARNLITLITSVLEKPIKLGWNININRKTTDAAIQTEQTSILTNIQDCVNREPINIIFPYGTAIFNSRTNTTIKDISDGGDMWAEDEIHLQEGLPCYIAALANVQALFNMYYPKYSVVNDNTLITDALIESWDVPQPHGSVVGMTSSNRTLAQTCAILSNNKPFKITNIY